MAIVEISVIPIGSGTTSISSYVAECHRELEKHGAGLNYELTAMGTIIEGDLELIFQVIRRLHETPFEAGAKRVSTIIKIDDRRDKCAGISQKVASVRSKL